MVGAWHLNERTTLVGLVSDANADRFDFGDIGEGDLFTAAEIHFKVAPRTPKAGYSKVTLWHTDGTKDGSAINAMTGPSGSGLRYIEAPAVSALPSIGVRSNLKKVVSLVGAGHNASPDRGEIPAGLRQPDAERRV